MTCRKLLALRGPNLWARFPVLDAWVDFRSLDVTAPGAMRGLDERLLGWLPGLARRRGGPGDGGARGDSAPVSLKMAMILGDVTLELQELAGTPAAFRTAQETGENGVIEVVIEYEQEAVGRACLESALRILEAAGRGGSFDVAAEIERLRAVEDEFGYGISTTAIVRAAEARAIPIHRPVPEESLLILGQGARQRRYRTGETDRTSAVAESIAQDKELTRSLLRGSGIPVPEGRAAASAEDAWEAARALGGPVVVKPRDGNHGRGVTLNLSACAEVMAAYEAARPQGRGVLVERYVPGVDHRLLVVGGRVVAAARWEPSHVTGDGHLSITQLVERLNAAILRGSGSALPTEPVAIDPALIAEQGYAVASVPPPGARIMLGRRVRFYDGGITEDVTPSVHPEVAACAEQAAHIVGLDVAGVDVVAEDLRRPLETQGGAVVEVNAGPGLQMHLPPSGPPAPVGATILATMFPEGEDGRIPIVAVAGARGGASVALLIARILHRSGRPVGLSSRDGTAFGDRPIRAGNGATFDRARDVLLNPRVEVAVLETPGANILREGLAFDRCQVAVITDLGTADNPGPPDEIATPEKQALALRTLVATAAAGRGTAVLNADDPRILELAESGPGSVFLFTRDGSQPAIAAHRARGGRAAFVRDGTIRLAAGDRDDALFSWNLAPTVPLDPARFQVEDVLAALAAAEALGIPRDLTCAVLRAIGRDERA